MPTEVRAHITGTVWKIGRKVADAVAVGGTGVILESMKMEMPVGSEVGGTVSAVKCAEGQAVDEGAVLVVIG